MFPVTSGATQAYLSSLDKIQQQMQQTQAQLSSGLKVQKPSDGPAVIGEILQIQSEIAQQQQVQTNLKSVQTDLSSADSALQIAVKAVENAISLGAQGANSTTTADERSSLAKQVAGLLQTLVDISSTKVNGRYIFSGDLDTQSSYQVDATQPTGVRQLIPTTATAQVADSAGTLIPVTEGAQQIFDARNADGSVASGNVFDAVNALLTSLQNNDQAGITNSLDSLQTADSYLNRQAAFYGTTEQRVTDAANLAEKCQTEEQGTLSQVRDADIPSLAAQLTQEQTQQQAALSVESTLLKNRNLFSYLA